MRTPDQSYVTVRRATRKATLRGKCPICWAYMGLDNFISNNTLQPCVGTGTECTLLHHGF